METVMLRHKSSRVERAEHFANVVLNGVSYLLYALWRLAYWTVFAIVWLVWDLKLKEAQDA